MRRARRFPQRLVRWTSLCVCLALVLTSLAMAPLAGDNNSIALAQGRSDSPNGKGRKVRPAPPETGAPAANLPNLNEVKRKRHPEPQAPPDIPSTMRSRRKPIESRRGRKVGDPGTTGGRIGANQTKDTTAKGAKDFPLRSSAKTSAASAVSSVSERSFQQSKFHHRNKSAIGNRKSRTLAPPPVGDDQFIQNFFYWAFLRYPNQTESTYWEDILRSAYSQGQTSLAFAGRELGMTLFESADYVGRGRSDHDYVYDLYKTYLMRTDNPDQGGWDFWTSMVPLVGRENVRHAFDECGEFAGIVASLTPNGSVSSAVSSLSTARVDPGNQTGSQLLARDCEWSVGLLSLPGRAGLDLGLGLSYSSLVWTRSGPSDHPYLYFNEDNSSPSPGFRLGFATVQSKYFDAQVGRNVYMLITSSGRRVELRQVGTSNIYEAGDSSYLQLINNGSSLLMRTTDGTQMTYQQFENEWYVTQIKDRNGNYLTVTYNSQSDLSTITDTLGRVIYFNYDGNANITSISQNWSGWWRTLVSFGWGSALSMNVSSFTGVSVVGTYTGESIPVLRQVGLLDGSYYTFGYTAVGQVNLITRYTWDNVEHAHMAYDYDGSNSDCPRITQTRVAAFNWTGINEVPSEVATQFSAATDKSWARVISPDGTIYKEFFPTTNWQKGLATETKVYLSSAAESADGWEKRTVTNWEHDGGTGASYPTNPRVTDSYIDDASGNHRHTKVMYASFSLPSDVYEYDSNTSTILRRTHTDYNLTGPYTDKRIIGLPSAQYLCDGAQGATPCNDNSGASLLSKVTLQYDEAGSVQYQASPTQHDDSNYGSGFVQGRANVSSTRRYDVLNSGQSTLSSVQYNTAGSVITATDPLNHVSTISYADSFSDSTNHNTYAYPTTLTDADGYSSLIQYNYDYGAQTRTQGALGLIQTFTYDAAVRADRVTTVNTGAYTRFWYGADTIGSYQSINSAADELFTNRVFDGFGRLVAVATNNPGSSGGYKAQWTQYDAMGRVMKQSNPTEIFWDWTPYGDDAAGRVYTTQTYDWKGRPLVTTHLTDGTQKYASYSACGCAGSEVATLTDEMGRQQKIYTDVLGRTAKTEILQTVNNITSVYSTTSNTYNARDQVTLVRQYQGADTSGVYQDTTMSYDGHGRLKTKHVPEQQVDPNNSSSTDHTTWDYNNDDTIQKVTDARGVATTFGYNARRLLTSITYPSSQNLPPGVAATANVTFGYDAAGNRTSMTDGLGSKSYNYNQLSQLMSETRTFNGVGTFTLGYDYNLAGELKKITDATNMTINYAFDSVGRLTGVTGSDSLYANVSNYASNFQYRAWGGLKAMTDGKGYVSSLLYNSKLQPSHFDISGNTVNQNYDYYNDGRISFVHNTTDANFDRSYFYDHLARLTTAKTGGMARGDYASSPYYETFGYDGFSNLTARQSQSWNGLTDDSDAANYTNNRRVGWGYDADGRNTTIDTRTNTFDAAGQQAGMNATAIAFNGSSYTVNQALSQDGDGAKVKEVDTQSNAPGYANTTYYLRSSVLGGAIIEEINSSGQKNVGYVYAAGQLLATQTPNYPGQIVTWKHNTPAGTSQYAVNTYNTATDRTEFDPLGADISLTPPEEPPPAEGNGDIGAGHFGGIMDARWSDFFNDSGGCMIDFMPGSCSMAMALVNMGAGVITDPYEMPSTAGAYNPKTGKFIGVAVLGWDRDTGLLGYSLFGSPQELADKVETAYGLVDRNYKKCAEALAKTGIGSAYVPSIEASKAILYASIVESTDATLIAVTWGDEAIPPFNFRPVSNYRPLDVKEGWNEGWDVGPMQTATTVWNKAKFTHGLADPFGRSRSESTPFDGDSYDNLRLGARALNDVAQRSTSRADTAGLYRAGSRTGPGYANRVRHFEERSEPYDDFFKCLRSNSKK